MNVCRQTPGKLLQIFEDARPRPVKIGAVVEDDEDTGVTEHGLGADALDVRSGQQRGDDGIRYLVFDNIGRLAGPVCVNHHLHVADVGQGVERHALQRPHACNREQYSRR